MERNLNPRRLKQSEPTEVEYSVTEFEYGIIQKFRMLDARGKKTVLTTLNNEYEYARQAASEFLAAHGAVKLTEEQKETIEVWSDDNG